MRPRPVRHLLAGMTSALVLVSGCAAAHDPTPVPSADNHVDSDRHGIEHPGCLPERDDVIRAGEPGQPGGRPDDPARSAPGLPQGSGCPPTPCSSAHATLDRRHRGFDIDLARAVADYLLGDPTKVQLVVITAADRIPAPRTAGSTWSPGT